MTAGTTSVCIPAHDRAGLERLLINLIMLLPPIVVLFISYRKVPAIPGIAVVAILGLVCALVFQGANYETAMNAAMSGYVSEPGNADVDSLLSRGGLMKIVN